MSSTNKVKRARRGNSPVLPYLTPELWSKVLERLPYGDIHGLITSDDPNLAIMSTAVTRVETIMVTRTKDLALLPPPGALASVKTLWAVCFDDPGSNPWYKRPEGIVYLNAFPIDTNLGSHIEKLVDLIAQMPNIQDVWPVGFDWGSSWGRQSDYVYDHWYQLPQLPEKLGYLPLVLREVVMGVGAPQMLLVLFFEDTNPGNSKAT